MKRKVLVGALLWTALITLVHVSLNVGWSELRRRVAVWRGEERAELIVGFLPVT